MRRLKVNTFFLFAVTVLFSITSIGYSALSQAVTVGGDATYSTGLLYSVFEKSSNSNYVHEYTGTHQDSMAGVGSNKIYHWYGSNDTNGTAILDKNNVIFAGHCWQMIRTTDTGGVKMIYNGEVENNQCLSTRGNHIGYNNSSEITLNSSYWYGTDYIYDKNAGNFKISGTTEQATWNATTGPSLIGKYTCKAATENGTCTTLYYIYLYSSYSKGIALEITNNSNYSNFGTSPFNREFTSPAHGGYMYNIAYNSIGKNLTNNETVLGSASLSTSYWYGDNITWGSPLENSFQVSSTSDYPNLVGKYTYKSTSQNYTNLTAYYIVAVNGTTMYYITLTAGNYLNYYNDTYTYGSSYTDNGNGTYTINNPTTIYKTDWYSNYSNLNGKYVCKNATNNTCSDVLYGEPKTNGTIFYYTKISHVYKYSKSFTYDGSKYILDNSTAINFWNISDINNINSITNAHYTCWNISGTCTTISYIHYIIDNVGATATPYIINLTDGKSVEDALDEMLISDTVNLKNSTIKTAVDAWYKKYLLAYDSYIEDTIFCNDRSISNLGGWNPDGGSINENLYFSNNYFVNNINLSCPNITDKFSISNNKALLTYKVGLMSLPELNILNNSKIRKNYNYWTISPDDFHYYNVYANNINSTGSNGYSPVVTALGVRPSISLKPGTKYTSGNGSMASPYVVDAPEPPYVYSINTNILNIGAHISDIGTFYTSPDDAITNFSKVVFLRHSITNSRITSSSVAFIRNGTTYYLQGGGATLDSTTDYYNNDSIYYTSNKQVLDTAFGSSNCTDHTTWYECSAGGVFVYAYAYGYVGADAGDWYCWVDADGLSNCGAK